MLRHPVHRSWTAVLRRHALASRERRLLHKSATAASQLPPLGTSDARRVTASCLAYVCPAGTAGPSHQQGSKSYLHLAGLVVMGSSVACSPETCLQATRRCAPNTHTVGHFLKILYSTLHHLQKATKSIFTRTRLLNNLGSWECTYVQGAVWRTPGSQTRLHKRRRTLAGNISQMRCRTGNVLTAAGLCPSQRSCHHCPPRRCR